MHRKGRSNIHTLLNPDASLREEGRQYLLSNRAGDTVSGLPQVHLPLYDPYTLLNVAVFHDISGNRAKIGSATMLGKLRIPLSTISSGVIFTVAFPMLPDRGDKGTTPVATCKMRLQVSS